MPATKNKQDGMVAFVVCIIIATVLTSITLSFVAVINREQRQSLDRQLSSQAFYAAESGINFAIKTKLADNPTCASGDVGAAIFRYTCLLIDNSPPDLKFDSVDTEQPTVFFMKDPTANLTKLVISWENAGISTNPAPACDSNCPKFLPLSDWKDASGKTYIGVLEISIYPLGSGALDRTTLQNNARTFYLYPTNSAASDGEIINFSDNGKVGQGNCMASGGPKKCKNVTIDSILASSAGYFVRMRALYHNVSVQINGFNGGTAISLEGAQQLIDSTGRANDVLRRVQVRKPFRNSYSLPNFALETADEVCKRQKLFAGGGTDEC